MKKKHPQFSIINRSLFTIILFFIASYADSLTNTQSNPDSINLENVTAVDSLKSLDSTSEQFQKTSSPIVFSVEIFQLILEKLEKNSNIIIAITCDTTQNTLSILTLNEQNEPINETIPIEKSFRDSCILYAQPAKETLTTQSEIGTRTSKTLDKYDKQKGRVYFITRSTLGALSNYTRSFNLAFPEGNPRTLTGLGLLFGCGGGLYGSYKLTQDMELGYGRVAMMNYGGELGTIYPLLLWLSLINATENKNLPKVFAWGSMFGFPLGIYAGSRVRFTGNFQYGNASIMCNMGRFSLLYGYLLPAIFYDSIEEEYLSIGSCLSMTLIPAGFWFGYRLVENKDYSSGRSVFISTAGLVGALTGLLIPTLFESQDFEVYAALTLIGHASGTFLGFQYRKQNEYTFGQGIFIAFSSLITSGLAVCFPFLAQSDVHQAYTISGITGAWGGLILGEFMAQTIFEKRARDKRISSQIALLFLQQIPMFLCGSIIGKSFPLQDDMNKLDLVHIRF